MNYFRIKKLPSCVKMFISFFIYYGKGNHITLIKFSDMNPSKTGHYALFILRIAGFYLIIFK